MKEDFTLLDSRTSRFSFCVVAWGSARNAPAIFRNHEPQKMKRLYYSCFAGFFLFISCSRKESKAPVVPPPVPVIVAQATTRNVPVEVRGIGNVEAYSTVSVRSQITGALDTAHFKEGQEVKAGDLLFTIDPRPLQSALNQVEANRKRDEAQLEAARVEFERTKRLFESKILAPDEFDKARAAYESSKATLAADSASVSNAALNLEYTQIRSPIDGRTGSIAIKAGNIVKAEDDRLVTINQLRPIYVTFSAPEQQLPVIRRRMSEATLEVIVNLPDSTNILARGTLTFVDNTMDATTGTIRLKATFENSNNALWPGQFLQARLVVDTLTNATVVPSQAVQSSQSGDFVFVVNPDSSVEKRNVVSGVSTEGFTVIEKSLQPGETIVTDGQMRLTAKSKVAVQKLGQGATEKTNGVPGA